MTPRGREGGLSAIGAAVATVALLAVVAAAVLALMSWREAPGGGTGVLPSPSAVVPSLSGSGNRFLTATPAAAPAIELTGSDGRPFSLAALRGSDVLVFFGYTHCPDVCPATIGILGQVLGAVGSGTRAVFVSIDPERDTVAWLSEYSKFLPSGIVAVTDSPAQIRATADDWGVRYARVETATPGAYSMSHTADVFLVDGQGRLRGAFPFGTEQGPIVDAIRTVAAEPAPSGSPPASASPASSSIASSVGPSTSAQPSVSPSGGPAAFRAEIASTSVWAEPHSMVILTLSDDRGPLTDPTVAVSVQLRDAAGSPAGAAVAARLVQPPGVSRVSYVATLDIPSAGSWQLAVAATIGGRSSSVVVDLTALDPGSTPLLGAAAPTARTPTLNDVGGLAKAITTDPQPDLRLSSWSTADLLAAHEPFVLVVDSPKFRVSQACGKALVMARYLQDRWPAVRFVHLEPFVYSIQADTPVLTGTLADPTLTQPAAAWGFGGAPWGASSMPWVFVVDGNGKVVAKYQGVMGSDDVDVVLSMLTATP